MKITAFVSHEDAPRHDTGWNHPDHQGRLPAIARAVYRDMETLFAPLLELSAQPACLSDLTLVHDPEYLALIAETAARAEREGVVLEVDGVPVSGATWPAVLASAGGAITGVDAVLRGEVQNAFVLARPPGRDAAPSRAARSSLVNTVAIAARHLRMRQGVDRVAVLAWGIDPPTALGTCLADDPGIQVVSVQQTPYPQPDPLLVPGLKATLGLPRGSDGAALREATFSVLEGVGPVDFLILSAGFDILEHDTLGDLAVRPDEVHGATVALREWAEQHAGGRLVSVLEGGYSAGPTARAVVQHVRALAGIPAA
jgi:acetoin utilization deacetylase AcuC-like enzyme